MKEKFDKLDNNRGSPVQDLLVIFRCCNFNHDFKVIMIIIEFDRN